MQLAGLVTMFLFALSIVLLSLFIFVAWVYWKDRVKEDLHMALVLLVVSMVLIAMHPTVLRYDSIRYVAYMEPDGEVRVILPIPNEQEVIDELKRTVGSLIVMVVDTEKGRGAQFTISKTMYFEVEVLTRIGSLDHSVSLMDGDVYWIHMEPIDDNATVMIGEFRIIHEDPFDLRSDQIFLSRSETVAGWNSYEYESTS